MNEVCSYERKAIFVIRESSEKSAWKAPSYTVSREPAAIQGQKSLELVATKARTFSLPLYTETLLQSSFREQLMGTFFHFNVSGHATRNMMTWLSFLPGMPTPMKALETSAFAISTAWMGQMHDDQVLLKESVRLYVRGIRELHLALKDPKLLYKDETLGACAALAIYEILQGDRGSYRNHCDGTLQLLKLRTPALHSSGLGFKIFLGCRFMGVSVSYLLDSFVLIVPTLIITQTLRAMERKEASFLSQKAWMELPWTSTPKSSFDQLLDLVLKAPDMIRRGSVIGNEPPEIQHKLADELFKDCLELDAQLELFYQSLSEGTNGPLHWLVLSEMNGLWKSPWRFEFLDSNVAATVILNWACSLMVRSGLCHLHAVLEFFQQQSSPSLELQIDYQAFDISRRRNFNDVAQNILLSVEYCLQKDAYGMRAPAILAPLAIAIDTLRDWPHCQEEYQAARRALQHAAGLGFKMAWPPVGERE